MAFGEYDFIIRISKEGKEALKGAFIYWDLLTEDARVYYNDWSRLNGSVESTSMQ